MVGTVSSAVVMAPILMLLYRAYGFAGHSSAKDNPLIAAQANLMASVSKGVFDGDLPWNFVFVGIAVAVGIIVLDEYLQHIKSGLRTPVLAVAIGIYLPFELSVPIFAGGLINHIIKLRHRKKGSSQERMFEGDRNGLLFASGLITGEALVGILLAIPIVVTGKTDILAMTDEKVGPAVGILLLVGIGVWLFRVAKGSKREVVG